MTDDLLQRLRTYGVVPVVEIDDAEAAAGLAHALSDAGLPVVEVTYRTAAAEESIRRMRVAVPDLLIGAGTVLDAATARGAAAAGADFLVAPGFNPQVAAAATATATALVPGVVTPTEIEAARAAGFSLLKFFPAVASGGIEMITALSGPYRDVSFMPTGGVREDSLAEWLALPAVAACGGTWIAPRDLISARDFDLIGRRAERAAAIARPTTSISQ